MFTEAIVFLEGTVFAEGTVFPGSTVFPEGSVFPGGGVSASPASWLDRRSRSRQRPRVGPMLPGGMPSRALISA